MFLATYLLSTPGKRRGSNHFLPSFAIVQGSLSSRRAGSTSERGSAASASFTQRRTRRFATRLSHFSLDAFVIPSIGVFFFDRLMRLIPALHNVSQVCAASPMTSAQRFDYFFGVRCNCLIHTMPDLNGGSQERA